MDIKNEKIDLESSESVLDADSLGSHVPDTSPRYHLYRYQHRYEGDDLESIGKGGGLYAKSMYDF